MKTVFFLLLALNLAVGAWLWLGGPVDNVHEPARLGLQVAAEAFRPLSDADVVRLRSQAEKDSAAAAAASAAVAELPQTDCILISGFSSDGAARKLRARLADLGLEQQVAVANDGDRVRLRVTAVDAPAEERIHKLLRDFPKLALEHCTGR